MDYSIYFNRNVHDQMWIILSKLSLVEYVTSALKLTRRYIQYVNIGYICRNYHTVNEIWYSAIILPFRREWNCEYFSHEVSCRFACGSYSNPFLTSSFTFTLLHHHHGPLADLGSTAQGNGHSVAFGRSAAGAGVPAMGARPSARPGKLSLWWNEQGAALAKAQVIVHCDCFTSVGCHMLRGKNRRQRYRQMLECAFFFYTSDE